MTPLRTRSDLTALAAQHAPSKACARAISEDRAQVLGGFTPAGGLPCFVITVKSKHGREWIIAIEINEEARRYQVQYLDFVPWACWDGRIGGKRLIDGDVPNEAAFQRMQAKRRFNVQLTVRDREPSSHGSRGEEPL